ncbi:MAG TPA: DUF4351 domain-containing protein, partial [Blastocatellia bacterium]|nr:DUF4351 domain-containing protein [Blastocatellia bacterium]
LIHIENQAQHQPNFAERMFTYFARLSQKYRLPVYPIALLTFEAPMELQPDRYVVEFPDRVVLDFRFRSIQLNRLDWREFARRDNPVASALMARMNIAPSDRPRVRLACIRLLATLKLDKAKMQVILGFVDTYLRLSEQEEQMYQAEFDHLSSAEKEEVMEVTILWKEEGRREGLQQGKQEGMLAVISQLLEQRFGSIDSSLRGQISRLNPQQLEKLVAALPHFAELSDITKWLQRLGS